MLYPDLKDRALALAFKPDLMQGDSISAWALPKGAYSETKTECNGRFEPTSKYLGHAAGQVSALPLIYAFVVHIHRSGTTSPHFQRPIRTSRRL